MAGFSTTEFRGMAGQPAGGGGLAVQQQTAVPVYVQNLDGAGQQAQANPALFQNLINVLSPFASKAARYAPGATVAAQQFGAGQPVAAGTTLGLTYLAGKGLQTASAGLPAPARAAVQLAGGLLAAPIAGQLGRGVQALGNQLIGGAQAATRDVASTLAGAQREAGQSAFTGKETGLGGISPEAMANYEQLQRMMQINIPTDALNAQYQIRTKMADDQVNRQMALNQQIGRLTGALNLQLAATQTAAQGMTQQNQLTSQILSSNPYASSVLNTGNVRGIY